MQEFSVDFYSPESVFRYTDYDAVVCVDVMATTTMLVTAVAQKRRSLLAAEVAEAWTLARSLKDPLLAGEAEGEPHEGFELPCSPADLVARDDVARPLILASGAGTRLLFNAQQHVTVYTACFRNLSATIDHVARHHERVALISAASRPAPNCEDQIAVARIAAGLIRNGFVPASRLDAEEVSRWCDADISLARLGRNAERLARKGRQRDVDFVMSHVDDLDFVVGCRDGEIEAMEPSWLSAADNHKHVF